MYSKKKTLGGISMKKLIVLLTTILILTMAVPVFAADQEADTLTDLYNQMYETRQTLIDNYVEQGLITEEQGLFMKQRMEQAQQFRAESGNGYHGFGFGFGRGMGMGIGFGGPGFGCGGW